MSDVTKQTTEKKKKRKSQKTYRVCTLENNLCMSVNFLVNAFMVIAQCPSTSKRICHDPDFYGTLSLFASDKFQTDEYGRPKKSG